MKVTIATATAGAVLSYTTDGSTPTKNSTRVIGPIDITTTTTLRVLGTKDGFIDSSVADFTVTIDLPPIGILPPVFSSLTGASTNSSNLSLSTTTAGASICYTTTGIDPTCTAGVCGIGSTKYGGSSIPITQTGTNVRALAYTAASNHIKVVACKPGTASSAQDLGTYALRVADPVTNVNGSPIGNTATVQGGSVVTFTSATSNTIANPAPAVGAGGPILASTVRFCSTVGTTATPPANPACTAAGACAAGSVDGVSATVNSTQQLKVIGCKGNASGAYQASGVQTYDFTVQGFGAPQFDLGTGDQPIFVRTGQELRVSRPAGTSVCLTTDNTAPACGAPSCTTAASPVVVPLALPAGSSSVVVRAITCNGTQPSTEVSAKYTLAASPLAVSATVASSTGAVQPGAVPSNPGPRDNNTSVPPASPGIDITISTENTSGVTSVANQGTYNATRPRRPAVGGSICYTLDGTVPAVLLKSRSIGSPAANENELNSALPLNGTTSGPANGEPGCVANIGVNAATVCIRNTGASAASVDKTKDPRLGNVSSSVDVRAVHCKNSTYANSAITDPAAYTFTPYSHTINFNGTPDAEDPLDTVAQSGWYTNGLGISTTNGGEDFPVSPLTTSVAGSDVLFATWDATYVYLGISLATLNQTPLNYLQFYIRGGEITPANAYQRGTTRSEPISTGAASPPDALTSPIGWPSGLTASNGTTDPTNPQVGCSAGSDCQRLPFAASFHVFVTTNQLATGFVTPMTTHFWDGGKWIANASVADVFSATANYAEIRIARAGIQNPAKFVMVGDYTDSVTAAASRAFPAGATITPGTVQDAPNVPTAGSPNPSVIANVGYLRLNLESFRYPDYYIGDALATLPEDGQSNYRKPTDVLPVDPRTSAPMNP